MPGRKALPDLVGRTLLHYRVLERIGEGGMGEVWLAEDLRLRRRVALKVLPAALASESRHLERFQREARSVAALNHPNIVTIHAVEEAEGLHFLVLELVEGETLADLLAAGPMSLERILEIALPLVEALEAIHQRGVIHRDLKPRNVMVSREGRIKLLDFGIARLTQTAQDEETSTETTLTKAGKIVGTTPYMSPEQLQGRPVDQRSDLFSCGILLYEMSTGQRPFRGKNQLSTAAAILYDTPARPSTLRLGLPSRFDEIVSLCLAKEPFLRYKSATKLLRDLKNLRPAEEPQLSSTLIEKSIPVPSDAGSSSSSAQRGTNPRLPARPRCFGREAEIRSLAEAICSDPPAPMPVLGPAGAGKTTITLAALHEGMVTERFGKRRWFIRCDGATDRDSLVGAIARMVCPDAAPPLEPKLFNVLEDAPAVLALDNLETPWERDTADVEDLLSELAAVSGLALVAALRGEQRPFGPLWREAIKAGPLDLESARSAFLAVAGERFQDDPDLKSLLLEFDGLALAVVLLANQAEGEPDLSMLRLRWLEQRTALLHRAGARGPQQSLEVSLELSIASPRMTDQSRKLLSILSLLPEGVAREDLSALLPEHGIESASIIRKVGLVFDQGSRLRMLAPVREHLRMTRPPKAEDFERVVRHYLELAKLGEKMGTEKGPVVYRRLLPEAGNLEPMILAGLSGDAPLAAIKSALAYGWLLRFTGQGSPLILEKASRVAQEEGEIKLEADCIRRRGDIAFSRSQAEEAEQFFAQAQILYARIKDLHGEASCMMLRGEVYLFLRSLPEAARRYFEKAHSIFYSLGDLSWEGQCLVGLGSAAVNSSEYKVGRSLLEQARTLLNASGDLRCEANCLQRMGQCSLEMGSFDQAQSEFETALLLFRQVGSLLGEANCIRNLGHILFRQSDSATARPLVEKALKLSCQAGSPIGEANCILLLGEISCALSEHAQAEHLLQQARLRFRRTGQVHGEGNATETLGINAWAQSDIVKARYWFLESLSLFQRIPQPVTVGRVHLKLANLAPSSSPERLEHIEAARRAWEEAGVLDQKRGELEAVAQAEPEST